MTAAPPQTLPQTLAPRLRPVHVGLREDLEVSRHLFRGSPSYVVRDPMTFQNQRLDPADYEIFVAIDSTRALSEIFGDLLERGKLTAEDEERFYQFVLNLHRLGFLHLPISDDKALYRRYQAKRAARRRQKLLGILFLRIPLWNPDAFLERTIRYVRPLFGRLFFFLWLALLLSAGWVLARQWSEFAQPLQGVLAARNLPLIWITLIVLKVFHEFGHSYACKHFGGHVPEMGAYLILFTPCAYMDATACWGFTRRRDRLVVCLAGMYVESVFAALAVFVWAVTGPSLVHDLAYNVILLAGVMTVLFNINPLMRFDGYYVLSDLTEVPNLRQRSTNYVLDVLKRVFLGLRAADRPSSRRLRALLLGFGISAAVYRTVLILAIAAILASKVFIVGLMLAVAFVGSTFIGIVRRLTRYLWHAEETGSVRTRAMALGVVVLTVLPTCAVVLPVPHRVRAAGLLTTERETVVRAKTAGFIERTHVKEGELVAAGDPLVDLRNDTCSERIAETTANLRAAHIRRDAYRVTEPARALQEEDRARACERALHQARTELADLKVHADKGGRVIACLRDTDVGSFLPEGSPIATVASGRWRLRALLTEEQITAARPRRGDEVVFRAAAMPGRTIKGVIAAVAPAGSRVVDLAPLTHLGGGDIVVDPATGDAGEPYFEVMIDVAEDAPACGTGFPACLLTDWKVGPTQGHLRHGMTGVVQLRAGAEPIARIVGRRLLRFLNRLLQE